MAAGLWTEFCGNPDCTPEAVKKCISGFIAIFYPDTCLNHGLVISIDFLLLLMFLYILTKNKTAKNTIAPPLFMTSALLNGGLGLAYLSFGIWKIYEKLNIENTICPLHGWLVLVIQGFTWLLLGCILGLQKLHLSLGTTVKLCSTIIFLFGGFLSLSSLWGAIVNQADLIKAVIDILCFLGATLSLICAFQRHNHRKSDNNLSDSSHYVPLKDGEASPTSDNCSNNNVTPFAKAGFLSRMSFWWLNPLMKQANGKILENNDFPRLRQEDQAQTWYSKYEELSKKRQEMHEPPSVLSVIFSCQKKPILVSGFFQLVKVLALSTGPLFLKALIDVTEGKAAFRYEGYALAGGLFLVKCLESLSERQLFFRTRLVGLQVRSLLSAAIYQKQLRLSNIARITHSPGDIMNYVALDAFKMSEFPYWFHMMWAIPLQLFLALLIVYHSVGLGTVAALVSLILSMLASTPLAKFQHKYQSKLVMAQDKRLKAMTEALANMKVLKLYAWERHFQNAIEKLRKEEAKWVAEVLTQRGYYLALFWSSSIVASVATFLTCYFLGIPLSANDIFTFLATLRIVQEPLRIVSDVAGAYIEAKVALHRITKFLEAPELQLRHSRQKCDSRDPEQAISIMATEVSWQDNSEKATLRNINFVVLSGEKVAICGGVGSGKSTLLAAILGEVPNVKGLVHVNGKIAYVSQTAWIQTGTIQDNILFGSPMDPQRYQEVLRKSSLVKDLEMFPMGDNTEIGERGVNLSGGQKQRIQLARALYKDADVYLLDDPFSAVDAHTATSLFNEYVMGALSGKTVMLVTHQVDFLPAFDSVLFVSDGILLKASSYEELLASSKEFQNLVNSQNEAIDSKKHTQYASSQRSNKVIGKEIQNYDGEQFVAASGDQLINQEERETGDVGLKPYIQYLKHDKGFLYFSLATMAHAAFVVGQYLQNYLLAADIRNGFVGKINLITTYVVIGCILPFFLLLRSFSLVFLSYRASESIFPTLLSSLFRAPMSFYDSTPLGRILTRVSSDMSTVDLEVAFRSNVALGSTIVVYFSYVVLAIISWPVLFVIIPMIYLTGLLQRYYLASAKEMMRINGTTKSLVANHLAESIAGAKIIRAFGEEERFFMKNLEVIDMDASPYFHIISANEWLIQRLEILCAIVVSFSVLALTWLPLEASSSGFVGLELSYGLSLSVFLVSSVQFTCMAENIIVSVERLEQYMHIPSEAVEVIQGHQPPHNWPLVGRVEICDLKIRYRPNAPLVLQGISCIFEGGHKIGIVGRTGSGKTTLVSALFRLVEPTEGRIIIDGIDISTIGLHDLRANLGIIPQDPTLFSGSVRYNLDPLSRYTDQEIWEVLEKCQLRRAIEEKEDGLDSSVVQDGSNWSMGQRQLFCLGRALLKRSKVLVLDEATASIDSATDSILQKTIRSEFGDCTVITVAHRIPTVIDCNMVLAMSDGKLMEYDEPAKLMSKESSLFGQLVKEYWARTANGNAYSENSH